MQPLQTYRMQADSHQVGHSRVSLRILLGQHPTDDGQSMSTDALIGEVSDKIGSEGSARSKTRQRRIAPVREEPIEL